MNWLRNTCLLAVVALVIAACGASTETRDEPSSSTVASSDNSSTTAPVLADGAIPEGPSALDDRFDPAFPDPLVDPNDVISGGPPPDGIPPIDEPEFVSVEVADTWLNDAEPVLVVDIGGDVRAYPIQILMWHEIVNDTVGGIPLSVTYCPLCNSAVTFERTVRGVETTFGTSGSLYFANLVMYDRTTESLWNQLDGRAVIGVLTGDVLNQVPSTMVAWSDFKQARPDAQVLDRDRTGATRNYGTNPYTGLDDPDGQPFLFRGGVDVRAKAMQRIVALELDGAAAAWSEDLLSDDSGAAVTTGEIAGQQLVIFWKQGQASALESSDVFGGREVGTIGVFIPVVDGQSLTFRGDAEMFIDNQTSSTWNVLGEAVEGELKGSRLEPVTFVRTFWFSWAAFRPDTELVD